MLQAIGLIILFFSGLMLQSAFVPAFLPRVLQPDTFILIGMTVLAFGSRELGLIALFLLGVCADSIGQGRFGLTPVCYLLAASAIMLPARRELSRGDLGPAWAGCVAGTVVSQLLCCVLANLFGAPTAWGPALGAVASRAIAACLWGLPTVYLTGTLLYKLRIMSPQVHSRWVNDERMAETRRRQAA